MSEYYKDGYGSYHLINEWGLTHSYHLNGIKKFYTNTTQGKSILAKRNWTKITKEEFWEAVEEYKIMRELVL